VKCPSSAKRLPCRLKRGGHSPLSLCDRPPQAYSYRELLPLLSPHFRVIVADWPGFGFSDKPQLGNGFQYSAPEYAAALLALVDELGLDKFSLVCQVLPASHVAPPRAALQPRPLQGFMCPAALLFATNNSGRLTRLALLNPPVRTPQECLKWLSRMSQACCGFPASSASLATQVTAEHLARLPGPLGAFAGPFLMGEILAQVRAESTKNG
jgi:pimeloyl-ACP methyl ester carboxylesterase